MEAELLKGGMGLSWREDGLQDRKGVPVNNCCFGEREFLSTTGICRTARAKPPHAPEQIQVLFCSGRGEDLLACVEPSPTELVLLDAQARIPCGILCVVHRVSHLCNCLLSLPHCLAQKRKSSDDESCRHAKENQSWVRPT